MAVCACTLLFTCWYLTTPCLCAFTIGRIFPVFLWNVTAAATFLGAWKEPCLSEVWVNSLQTVWWCDVGICGSPVALKGSPANTYIRQQFSTVSAYLIHVKRCWMLQHSFQNGLGSFYEGVLNIELKLVHESERKKLNSEQTPLHWRRISKACVPYFHVLQLHWAPFSCQL